MACCLAKCCRRNGGVLHGCTSIEAITMNQPTISTSNYEDQCGCRTCGSYPNSVWAILPAQILAATAAGFCMVANFDYRLVQVPNTPENGIDDFTIQLLYNGTKPLEIISNNATYRSMGFTKWEGVDGECASNYYHYAYNTYGDNDYVIDMYQDWVGTDFERIHRMGTVIAGFGILVVAWMICLLSCVAHTRRYRTILVILLTIILPILQSLIFRVHRTEFCKEKNCSLGEAGRMVIVSIVLYIISGILLYIGTRDFPGNPYKKSKPFHFWSYISGQSSETVTSTTGDNTDTNQCPVYENATNVVGMMNYSNGFGDAIEIPVESAFIDRTLIDLDAVVPPTPTTNFSVDSITDDLVTSSISITDTTPSDSISKEV